MSAPLTLSSGGEGEAVDLAGEVLRVVLPRAFAPGAPVTLTVDLDAPVTITGKTIGSKLRDDGRFDVRLRLVNLRRSDREALARLAT